MIRLLSLSLLAIILRPIASTRITGYEFFHDGTTYRMVHATHQSKEGDQDPFRLVRYPTKLITNHSGKPLTLEPMPGCSIKSHHLPERSAQPMEDVFCLKCGWTVVSESSSLQRSELDEARWEEAVTTAYNRAREIEHAMNSDAALKITKGYEPEEIESTTSIGSPDSKFFASPGTPPRITDSTIPSSSSSTPCYSPRLSYSPSGHHSEDASFPQEHLEEIEQAGAEVGHMDEGEKAVAEEGPRGDPQSWKSNVWKRNKNIFQRLRIKKLPTLRMCRSTGVALHGEQKLAKAGR